MKSLQLTSTVFNSFCMNFNQILKFKGYARGKNSMYPACVKEFLYFCEGKGINKIEEITSNEVSAYKIHLLHRPNQRRGGLLSESMIRHHLYSLRLFFDYLMDMEIITASPARFPKFTVVHTQAREILTLEEIREVYKVCKRYRDRVIVSLAYGCGLRRTEIEKLNLTDLDLHKGILIVRDGKGGNNRIVPLSRSVTRDLKIYLQHERPVYRDERKSETAVIINRLGKRTRGQDIQRQLKKILHRTKNPGIFRKNITLHSLRHSIATHLLENGAKIQFVKDFLGHAEVDTVMIYSKRRRQKQQILQAL